MTKCFLGGMSILWIVLMGFVIPASSQLPEETSRIAVVEVNEGSSCVLLLADIWGGEGFEAKFQGHGNKRHERFFFRGSEVATFPQPAQVEMHFYGQCQESSIPTSYVVPDFVKHLRFRFEWNFKSLAQEPNRHQSKAVVVLDTQSVWKEGDSKLELSFEVPAQDIPIGAVLRVDILHDEKLLTTFMLRI